LSYPYDLTLKEKENIFCLLYTQVLRLFLDNCVKFKLRQLFDRDTSLETFCKMGMEDMQPEYPDDQFAMPSGDIDYPLEEPAAVMEVKAEEVRDEPIMDDPQEQSGDGDDPIPESDLIPAEQNGGLQSEEIKEETTESAIKAEEPEPASEFDALQTHLAQNRYDPSAWNRYIELAEESGDLAKIKQAYESLLQAYPNTVRHFLFYIACIYCYLTRLNMNILTSVYFLS